MNLGFLELSTDGVIPRVRYEGYRMTGGQKFGNPFHIKKKGENMTGEKKQSAAIGYKKTSKDGTKHYLEIVLNTELINAAQPDAKGQVRLIGFANDFKKTEQDPDIKFKVNEPRVQGAAPSASTVKRAATQTTAKLPF